MLYHNLDASSPGVDVEQVICELPEAIDPRKFEQAWRQVVARHEILRTGFRFEAGGEPRQFVIPAEQARLDFHHEEFSDEAAVRRGLQTHLAEDRRRGFPNLAEPLIRIALLRGGPEYFWFASTFHHLLLDGRALVVMFKEAFELHDALAAGRVPELPAVHPYRGYIEWLQATDWSRAEKFWREYLKGLTAPTRLPVGRSQTPAMDPVEARGELAFQLSPDTTTALRTAATGHKVTLNTVMQAAWAIVLSRYTGEADVVFGAVRACRHIPVEGAGSIVGLFINTVPVRVRVPEAEPLGPWLQQLREQWVTFRDYEHTPLMLAQQWSEIAPGRPLFETLFNYQEPSWDAALRALGGKWERRHFDIVSQPNYPLAVDAYGGAVVTVKMLYDRRRFTDETAARLIGHYRVVVEALAGAQPATPGAVPLLSQPEERRLLGEWNGHAMDVPREVCVHALVAALAEAAPTRIAASDTTATLTYGELNSRADRLARRLRTHGVGPDTVVAVCVERSVLMLVAWLGVLKAGGAFCPLDPGYPPERLGFMLEDAQASVLLTQLRLAGRLAAHASVLVCVDAEETLGGPESVETDAAPHGRNAGPGNLAYVIYTSGSTGQPKGVMIEHRALMNLVTWHQRAFGVTSADRATQLASPAFDASVWEVWPYLAAGASIHIPSEEARITPVQLWRWFAENRITIGFLPTPLLEAAMTEPWPADLSLRLVLTGGDKLKRRPPANFPCALINNYGPTEYTVVTTSGVVDPRGGDDLAPTIGRPIANTRALVLDAQRRPVPIGVPGELFIGGDSLARGYLRRPELTEEKFITLRAASYAPDPDGSTKDRRSGLRAYRTGDRVRWTEDGELEYLGRLDGQVKIRGCRIELGEIEALLERQARVREGLVVVRPDERGEPQLVAYAIPAGDADHAARDLRIQELELLTALREKLPGYMVPSAIVFVERWPLTPNGKIDRQALPAPAPPMGKCPEEPAAPATVTEQMLARIWTEILGRPSIGRHDNFFDLGGHSLLAAQVVSRLNQALQTALSVRLVFDQPTLAGLAREIDARRQAGIAARTPTNRLTRRRTAEALQPN